MKIIFFILIKVLDFFFKKICTCVDVGVSHFSLRDFTLSMTCSK